MTDLDKKALEAAMEVFGRTRVLPDWSGPVSAAITAYLAALPSPPVVVPEEAPFDVFGQEAIDAAMENERTAQQFRDDLVAAPSPPALDGAGREGWQPIETAPKDGTCIYLAWNSEDWTFGEGMWSGDGWIASAAFYNPDLPHPRMEFREYRPNNPLLWQPLPVPPKETP